MKFNVGDKVRIAKTSEYYYGDSTSSNPKDIEGIVTDNDRGDGHDFPYLVTWDNGTDNSYQESDLELVNTQTTTTKMTTNQTMKNAVLATAKDLLKANNTVTTLEVKVELRKAFPHFRWKQHTDVSTGVPGVSELMAELAVDGEFSFSDNGTYRIYSLVGAGVLGTQSSSQTAAGITGANPISTTTSTAIAKVINVTAKKAKKTPTKAKSISKAKALDLIQNSKGHFFKAVFIKKKDGKERTLNGQYVKGQTVSPLGLVRVKESSLMKKLKKTGDINTIPSKSVIRSFNINNLKTLGIAGQNYKIRK